MSKGQYWRGISMLFTINLPPDTAAMVQQKVASGIYSSASEMISEALNMMETIVNSEEAKLAWLRAAVAEGEDTEGDAPWDLEEFLRECRRSLESSE